MKLLKSESQALKGVHLKDVSQHPLPAIFERDDADMDELLENGFFRKVLGIYNAPYSEVSCWNIQPFHQSKNGWLPGN